MPEKGSYDLTEEEHKKSETMVYQRKVKPYLDKILEWRAEGKGVEELCYLLDIQPKTFYLYRKNYPEFREAYEIGTNILADKIETSLYKEATGYDYYEQSLTKQGEPVDVKKHARPQISASKFALTNLRPDKWKNRTDAPTQTTLSGVNVEALKSLSKEDLRKLLEVKEGNKEDDDDEQSGK